MQPFLPAIGVSRKNRKIISLVSGKEFLTVLCFQAYPSIGLSKSGDIPMLFHKFNLPLHYVRLAAEGAYRPLVHRCAAVGALALQKLPAHGAVLAAHRIRRLAIRQKQPNLFHKILMVRRTIRIWTEA